MLVRRFGRPGLLGTMARTAIVAGTASATVNAVNRRAAGRAQDSAEAEAYEEQQVAARLSAAAPPPAPAPANDDALGDQLTQLARLHEQGALTESEFTAAKQQLLG